MDAVLYLLDYSKLKTAEEATLLGKLKVRCWTHLAHSEDLHPSNHDSIKRCFLGPGMKTSVLGWLRTSCFCTPQTLNGAHAPCRG